MQKNKDYHDRLKVSLHGMNDRAYKMMVSYLELYCKGLVYVVIENEAQAEIVDIDSAHSKSLLEKKLTQQPPKPIIVLSVQEVLSDNVIYVKKPLDISHIVEAIKTVKKKIQQQTKQKKPLKPLKSNPHDALAKEKKLELATEEITPAKISPLPLVIPHPEKNHTKDIQEEALASLPDSEEKAEESANVNANTIDKEITKAASSPEAIKHSVEPPTSNEKPNPIRTTIVSSYKVNDLLDDFLSDDDSFDFFGASEIESLPSNNRRTVRYAIHSIKAKLVRNSMISSKKIFVVWVLNVSSKGALIEMEVPVKLKGKVILTIYFDPEHIFSVPARIVRNESSSIYGLQFLSYQHELADYLVENDSSFSIA